MLASACSACSDGSDGDGAHRGPKLEPAPRVDLELTRSGSEALTIAEPGGELAEVLPPGPDGQWLIAGRRRDADGTGRPVVWRSADGLAWRSEDVDPEAVGSFHVNGAARRGDTTVVVGGQVQGAGSRGVVWTAGAAGPFERVDGDEFGEEQASVSLVEAGPERFVAAGRAGDGAAAHPVIWTSPDGRTWAEDTAAVEALGAADDPAIYAAAQHGTAIVLGGRVSVDASYDAGLWFSADGAGWERIESDVFAGPGAQVVNDLTVVGTGWLASGHVEQDGAMVPAIWRSEDGRSWQRLPTTFHDLDRATQTWGQSMIMVRAAAADDLIAIGGNGAAARVWRSTDAVTWTEQSLSESIDGSSDHLFSELAVTGRGDAVVMSGTGSIRSSVVRLRPGEPVVEVTAGSDAFPAPLVSGSADGVTRVGDRFLAWGDRQAGGRPIGETTTDALVWQSTDGSTWERVDAGPAFTAAVIRQIISWKGSPLAVGVEPFDPTSDGRSDPDPLVWLEGRQGWQRLDPDVAFPALDVGEQHTGMTSVLQAGDHLVAAGHRLSDGVDPIFWTSADGLTWTAADRAQGGGDGDQHPADICALGSGQVAVGDEQIGSRASAAAWVSVADGAWSRSDGPAATDGRRESMAACASTADGAVAVGSRRLGDGTTQAAVWSTADGGQWSEVESRSLVGDDVWMDDVVADGDTLLATGHDRADGGTPAMWRSDDGGKTWRRIRLNVEVLRGTEPGSISGVHLTDGRVVVVGSVDGSPAIWNGRLR